MTRLAWGSNCSVKGCADDATGWTFSSRCAFHDAVFTARELSPESFDRLRAVLSEVSPITDEDRRERRLRSALSSLRWSARDFRRAKVRALDEGATREQVAETVRAGKAEAR